MIGKTAARESAILNTAGGMPLLEVTLIGATAGLLVSPYPALALLPGVLAAAGIVMARYPVIALYAIILLIPFGALRKIGGINLPWVLAMFLLALLAVQVTIGRTLPGRWSSALWPLMLAYLGVNVVSAGLSAYPNTATYELFLILSAYVFVLLVMCFLSEEGFARTLPRVIAWSLSAGSLLSIASYALGVQAFTETTHGGARVRFVGGAIDPNNQSIMILFAMPLIVHLALSAPTRRERLVMAGLGFLNVLSLMLTLSRSGFLMGILMALSLLFHYRRRLHPKRLGAVIALGVIAAMALAAALPSAFYQRQESLAEWDDRSLLRRTSYLGVAWDAFVQHPVIGSGPGTFVEIYGESEVTRLFTSKEARTKRRAHNTYLEILVGSGLLGFGLYMAVLGCALFDLRRAERMFCARGDRANAELVACYRIAFSVLLVFLLVLSEMYHKYMLLSLGLSQVAVHLAGRAVEAPRRDRAAEMRAALPGLGGGGP